MTPQPLRGRRVLDLSQYIAGSACSQLLSDFGADVTKVEPPAGDPARGLGTTPHGSSFFRQYNTGKTSVSLDLASAPDREQLDLMLADADAVVMNYGRRTMHKFALDWPSLHARHPHLVSVVVSAYGSDDDRTAFDSVAQAVSGFGYLNADEEGAPRISAGYPTDVFSGLYAGLSAAMALLDSETGGVLIDVPMVEVAMSALCGAALLGGVDGLPVLPGVGNRDAATTPSNTFACADGYAYVYAGLDKHWQLLREITGGPMAPRSERLADPEPYEQAVSAWTRDRTVAEVCEVITSLGVTAGPVNHPMEALREVQERRPDAVVGIADGAAFPQYPVYFDGERVARRPSPALNQEDTP